MCIEVRIEQTVADEGVEIPQEEIDAVVLEKYPANEAWMVRRWGNLEAALAVRTDWTQVVAEAGRVSRLPEFDGSAAGAAEIGLILALTRELEEVDRPITYAGEGVARLLSGPKNTPNYLRLMRMWSGLTEEAYNRLHPVEQLFIALLFVRDWEFKCQHLEAWARQTIIQRRADVAKQALWIALDGGEFKITLSNGDGVMLTLTPGQLMEWVADRLNIRETAREASEASMWTRRY